jgi:hypothetical protein
MVYSAHLQFLQWKPPLSLLKYINRSECIKTVHTEEGQNRKDALQSPFTQNSEEGG